MTKSQRDRIIVGERPVVSTELLDDTNIRYQWKTSLLAKDLKYDLSRCVGCSLCLPCPWEAITLGPVQEVAAKRLEGAPLILIDEDKCTFCGLCDSACIFNALEANFDETPAELEYARLKGRHVLDEDKCAPCLLCAKICPLDAITVDVKVKPKTELVTYKDPKAATRVAEGNPDAKGTIKISEDKCTWCGLCELLCPECITIYWLEEEKPQPPDFKPAVDIRVNTKHCDYCGLCEEICPSEAIKITCESAPTRTIQKPEVEGKLTIDDDKCVDCTLCAQVCPYEALDVTLPLTGRVHIEHLERCDPTGCVNCFNICPTKAIYATGDEQKLAVREDICVFCGACENACPDQVLRVTRDSYRLAPLEKVRAWERARASLFFDILIGQQSPPSNLYDRPIQVQPRTKPATLPASTENWPRAEEVRQEAQARIRKIQLQLRQDWRLRLKFERGHLEKLSKETTDEEPKED